MAGHGLTLAGFAPRFWPLPTYRKSRARQRKGATGWRRRRIAQPWRCLLLRVGPLARLNVLVCQYHLGHTQLNAERALRLLQCLPTFATLTRAGLALPLGTLNSHCGVVIILANEENRAFDLPSDPTFVKLQPDMQTWGVLEVPPVLSSRETTQRS